MTAADSTKTLNMVIGAMIVSFWVFKREPKVVATKTITTIYKAAARACKNGFFIVLIITKIQR